MRLPPSSRSECSCHGARRIDRTGLNVAANASLTPRELEFMANGASCDFVLYFKVGKTPLGVIEVDGGSHDTPQQAELEDRKGVGQGKSVSVRVDLGGSRIIKKKKKDNIDCSQRIYQSSHY